jgi:hypothetical protein
VKGTTKTITVLLADEEACIDRWRKKGWSPISITYMQERDRMRRSVVVGYCTIVFAKMGKPA